MYNISQFDRLEVSLHVFYSQQSQKNLNEIEEFPKNPKLECPIWRLRCPNFRYIRYTYWDKYALGYSKSDSDIVEGHIFGQLFGKLPQMTLKSTPKKFHRENSTENLGEIRMR